VKGLGRGPLVPAAPAGAGRRPGRGGQPRRARGAGTGAGRRGPRAQDRRHRGEAFVDVARQVLLWTLDEKWRDHLFELDHLKAASGCGPTGRRTRCSSTSARPSTCSARCSTTCMRNRCGVCSGAAGAAAAAAAPAPDGDGGAARRGRSVRGRRRRRGGARRAGDGAGGTRGGQRDGGGARAPPGRGRAATTPALAAAARSTKKCHRPSTRAGRLAWIATAGVGPRGAGREPARKREVE